MLIYVSVVIIICLFDTSVKLIKLITGDPFLSGSRYGRSGLVNMKNSKTVPKVLEILPRVDRFFTGPRFGKRAHTESQNEASLKSFEAALNYLDRMQHIELIKRDDSINYDKSNENNGNEEKKETKQNQVLCQMFRKSEFIILLFLISTAFLVLITVCS